MEPGVLHRPNRFLFRAVWTSAHGAYCWPFNDDYSVLCFCTRRTTTFFSLLTRLFATHKYCTLSRRFRFGRSGAGPVARN